MKVLGIDEAGRGPVVGPLVMCAYMIDEKKIPELKKLGVRDSKMLTGKQREALAPQLKKLSAGIQLEKISAQDIDRLRSVTNLNRIEITSMQNMINKMKPDKVIVDAIESNVKAFAMKLRAGLENGCELVCENFADKNHLPVSAASVIAKVNRDSEIERLRERYGFKGTGYPSDPATIKFLREWLSRNSAFPDFVRSSWITAQALRAEKEQTRIGDF